MVWAPAWPEVVDDVWPDCVPIGAAGVAGVACVWSGFEVWLELELDCDDVCAASAHESRSVVTIEKTTRLMVFLLSAHSRRIVSFTWAQERNATVRAHAKES
jgi:hypothetical protein